MGVITEYACAACGYRAEIYEGAGFVIKSELRHCRGTNDLVGVIVGVHGKGDRKPPPDLPIGVCPDCGSADVVAPARVGARRRVACPRCGEATRRSDAGRWD